MLPSGCSAKEMTRGTGSPIARAHMVPITSCARNSSKRTSLRIKLKGRGRTPLTGRSPDHLQYRRPIGTKRTLWKNPRTRSQNLDWIVGMGGNYRFSSQAADKNISQLTSRSCLIWDVDMLTCRYTTKEGEKDELIDGERRDLARNRTTTSTWSPTTPSPSRRIQVVIGCFRCSRPVTFSAILQYQNLRGSKVSLCRNVLRVDSTTYVSGETLALQAWSAIGTDRRSAVILDGPEVHKYCHTLAASKSNHVSAAWCPSQFTPLGGLWCQTVNINRLGSCTSKSLSAIHMGPSKLVLTFSASGQVVIGIVFLQLKLA